MVLANEMLLNMPHQWILAFAGMRGPFVRPPPSPEQIGRLEYVVNLIHFIIRCYDRMNIIITPYLGTYFVLAQNLSLGVRDEIYWSKT
jgi:hypothetical protein